MKRLFTYFRQRSMKILSSREAYRRWAETYPPHAHNPFMVLEENTMKTLMPDLQGKQVLDLACGTGRWGNFALQQGAKQVYSVDDSRAMLKAGRPSLACEATMTHLPLSDRSIEVVLCGLAIGHTPHIEMVYREIGRVLVPGGVALISDIHPFQTWQGALRQFKSGEKTFAVEHHLHSFSDHLAAAQAGGLQIEAVREIGITAEALPSLLVLHLVKLLEA